MTRPSTAVDALTSPPVRFGRAPTQSGAVLGASALSEEDARAARASLGEWLRGGRVLRGLSIADIARVTKIQARILEDLEAGEAEGLPADVFVRGFVRSYARCVGLSDADALARYSACSRDAGPVASAAATAATELYAPTGKRARISTVVPVEPGSSSAMVHLEDAQQRRVRAATSPGASAPFARLPRASTVEPVAAPASVATARSSASAGVAVAAADAEAPAVAVAAVEERASHGDSRKKGRGKKRRDQRSRRRAATVRPAIEAYEDADVAASAVAPAEELLAVAAAVASVDPAVAAAWPQREAPARDEDVAAVPAEAPAVANAQPRGELWVPRMPPPARPTRAPAAPTLLIDDADPESASRQQEERAKREERDPTRRTFLPPILLETQERAHRQGGLTLAVIILLIAATLTLSYLMRRPSSTGNGVTSLPALRAKLG
ncbi:MAG: helix-turn-helix transcriptional regulator [Kofleriaceae bacterium]